MMYLNQTQVQDQMFLFEGVMNSTDLVKFGKRLLKLGVNNATTYNFIRKYLGMLGVSATMYHPERISTRLKSYHDILQYEAIVAYSNSLA